MARVGDVLDGKYRLERLIGSGGMGEVFLANHLRLDKQVAVKCLFPDVDDKAQARARLEREARASASIGHPSIVDVYDIGATEAGELFIVMERLRGESLDEHLDGAKKLDAPFLVYIACQVLSALSAAHERGIVHRDLKPGNIFLVDAKQTLPRVKLMDFGISKVLTPESATATPLTATGAVLGTPLYMSPEQAMGEGPVDSRCDIFSMGSVLYRCSTGREPFQADNYLALIHKIAFDEVVPPRELVPEIPVELERAILKSMAKDRDERFSTAAEMFQALCPLVDDGAVARLSLPDGVGPERLTERAIGAVAAEASPTKPSSGTWTSTDGYEALSPPRSRTLIVTLSGWFVVAVLLLFAFFSGQLGGGAADRELSPADEGEAVVREGPVTSPPTPPPRGTKAEQRAQADVESTAEQAADASPSSTAATSKVPERRRNNAIKSGAGARGETGARRGGLRPKRWDGELFDSSADE